MKKKDKDQALTHNNAKEQESGMVKVLERPIAKFAFVMMFALFAVVLLAAFNHDYLRKVEAFAIFLPDTMFFRNCMLLPGGLLDWVGSYLNQFFYHPWLGASIYSALLACGMWVVYKSMRLPQWGLLWAVIPPAMLLLSFLSLGYIVYSIKTPVMAFSNILGLLVALVMFWDYRAIVNVWVRTITVAIIVTVGYPLFGFYGLLSAALCLAYELSFLFRPVPSKNRWLSIVPIAIGVVFAIALPLLYYRYSSGILMKANVYTSGLPMFYENEKSMWMPYIIGFGFLLVMAFCSRFWNLNQKSHAVNYGFSAIVYLGMLCVVVLCKCNDRNFQMSVSLERAIMDDDWQKAVEVADNNQDIQPTRLNVLFTDIALMRLGQAGEKMFSYRIGSAPYNTTRKPTAMRDAGAQLISLHMGRTHNAYRWAMEYMVEYGQKPDYLKVMAKSALLMGEYDLARKYLNTLKRTKYHKDWAERYIALANDPALIEEDKELSDIKKLMCYRDHLGGDGGKLESYLMPVISSLRGGSHELLDLSLQCNLIQKNIDGFMPRFGTAAESFQPIPKHYQEAVVLWSELHGNDFYKRFDIDPKVIARFEEFKKMNQMLNHYGQDANDEYFRKNFGDTYWYYFFFVSGMKTT